MQCEMCGRSVVRTRRFLVEKTVLNVGPECEKFGKALDATPGQMKDVRPGNVPLAMEMRKKRGTERDVYADQSMQLELVEDYAIRIQQAREKKGWTRQDLGGRVGEREATLTRIEAGGIRPTDTVARKMERELGITLYQKVENVVTKRQASQSFTLGDILRDALGKGKKSRK